MYLGRYRLGEVVPIVITAQTAGEVPTEPDACPTVIVYDSGGSVETKRMAIIDRYEVTAVFFAPVYIGAEYSTGYHTAEAWWTITNPFSKVFTFQVIAGGHRDGPILAMGEMSFPAASYILGHTSLGRIRRFRNPRSL